MADASSPNGHDAPASPGPRVPRWRRMLQFELRSLMLFVAVVAVACWLYTLWDDPYGKKAGEERTLTSLKITFCWCPPGTFLMGSPETEPGRIQSENQVSVTLTRGFWLGKYEVTQEEWETLMGENPSWFSSSGDGKQQLSGMTASRFPVERVTWEEAMKFCEKLTEQERAAGRLPQGWEYTLPTEAQWEHACRAGTMTATAFGDRLGSHQANFDGGFPLNGAEPGPDLRRTTTVGSYTANAWGLHDMHGNVWEWCRDMYQSKLPGGTDPEVSTTATYRVDRGGGWSGTGGVCRSAVRSRLSPGHRYGDLGFRVALVQASK